MIANRLIDGPCDTWCSRAKVVFETTRTRLTSDTALVVFVLSQSYIDCQFLSNIQLVRK